MVKATNESKNTSKVLGKKVVGLRHAYGMTQDVLASKAGLNRKTIMEVEKGTQDLSLKSLTALAGALGVKPSELIP